MGKNSFEQSANPEVVSGSSIRSFNDLRDGVRQAHDEGNTRRILELLNAMPKTIEPHLLGRERVVTYGFLLALGYGGEGRQDFDFNDLSAADRFLISRVMHTLWSENAINPHTQDLIDMHLRGTAPSQWGEEMQKLGKRFVIEI